MRDDITVPRLQEIEGVVKAHLAEVAAWAQPGRILSELGTLQTWIAIKLRERIEEEQRK